jgi:hypothetical protein
MGKALTSPGSRTSMASVNSWCIECMELINTYRLVDRIDVLTLYIFVRIKLVKPIAMAWAIRGWKGIVGQYGLRLKQTRNTHNQSSLMNGIIDQLRLQLFGDHIHMGKLEAKRDRSLVRCTNLVLACSELSSNCSISQSDRQCLCTINPLSESFSKAHAGRSSRRTFFAVFEESATMAIRPLSNAPYVSCASGGSVTIPSRET